MLTADAEVSATRDAETAEPDATVSPHDEGVEAEVDAQPSLPDSDTIDAEVPDAEIPDAEIPDVGRPDADFPDQDEGLLAPDGSIEDAQTPPEDPDADVPDAEQPDVGQPDAELADAELPDPEVPDADTPDAAPVDVCADGIWSPIHGELAVDCGGPCPPCPVAEPMDPEVVDDLPDPQGPVGLVDEVSFLFEGPEASQLEVMPDALDTDRLAVVRGHVIVAGGAAFAGARVEQPSDPDVGWTLTDADGDFDLAVNGGGLVRIRVTAPGYLPVDRTVEARWHDFALAEPIALTPLDAVANPVIFDHAEPQVAQGSTVEDEDGARTPTLLMPPAVQGTLVMADGTRQPLEEGVIRITEYTVAEDGPAAMPGRLPPTSAYTHAVEMSVDAALASGATRVEFDRPLYYYVENYLGFPVGEIVPVGYYDRSRGVWVPSDNGRVIAVIGHTDDLADLDIDGDGAADTDDALSALGITDTERAELATLYAPGTSLWRSPIPHFTPWDFNWPFGPPEGAERPSMAPSAPDRVTDPCEEDGSIIYCDQQALGEHFPIAGSEITLTYRSDFDPGRGGDYHLDVPLLEDEIPEALQAIEITVEVAGRSFVRRYAPQAGLTHTFQWDGRDGFGQVLQRPTDARLHVDFIYPLVYYSASQDFERAFAAVSGETVFENVRDTQEITLRETHHRVLGRGRPPLEGGLGLSVLHRYVDDALLVRGDGTQESLEARGIIGVRRAADLPTGVTGMVGRPDGRLTVFYQQSLLDVTSEAIDTVAPPPLQVRFSGETLEGPAGLDVQGAALDPVTGQLMVRSRTARGEGVAALGPFEGAVGPDHRWLSGLELALEDEDGGDGVSAQQARFGDGKQLAVGPDQTIYVPERLYHRVRIIRPDGVVETFAGTGAAALGALDRPATEVALRGPTGVAACGDDVFIADSLNHRIVRVDAEGIAHLFAGTGVQGPRRATTLWGPATEVAIHTPELLACDGDGGVFFASSTSQYVGHVSRSGLFQPAFGDTDPDGREAGPFDVPVHAVGESGNALRTPLINVQGLAVLPDGRLAVVTPAGFFGSTVWIVERRRGVNRIVGESVVADGGVEHVFTPAGRHLQTRDLFTGETIRHFEYDDDGRLSAVRAARGPDVLVLRDDAGDLTGFVASGHHTTVALGPLGRVITLNGPEGQYDLRWDVATGQLVEMQDPGGGRHRYRYDAVGRLVEDVDPEDGTTTLTLIEESGHRHVRVTDGEGHVTDYIGGVDPDGQQRRTVINDSGALSLVEILPDGRHRATHPDGTITEITYSPDPQWGAQRAYISEMVTITPGGRRLTVNRERQVEPPDPEHPMAPTRRTTLTTTQGATTTHVWDPETLTETRTSAEGVVQTSRYSVHRRLRNRQVGDRPPLQLSYDDSGRLTSATLGEVTTEYAYTEDTITVTDGLERERTQQHDASGRPLAGTLPSGRTLRYARNARGLLTDIDTPSGDVHTLRYDGRGRLAGYDPPGDAPGLTRTYTAARRWQGYLFPGGRRLERTLDDHGRWHRTVTPEATIEVQYPDLTDRPQRLSRVPADDAWPIQHMTFRRDGGLLTGFSLTSPSPDHPGAVIAAVDYTFDDDMMPTERTLDAGDTTWTESWTFDGDGRLVGEGPLTYTRGGAAREITTIEGAGFRWDFTLDDQGRPHTVILSAGGVERCRRTLSRDAAGRIASITEDLGEGPRQRTFERDADDQLLAVRAGDLELERYAYDEDGNRTGAIRDGIFRPNLALYDAADRLLELDGAASTYDADGHLVAQGDLAVHYDTQGHLLSAQRGEAPIVRYGVDPLGRRTSRWTDGETQRWLYANPWSPFTPTHHQRDGGSWDRLIHHPDTGHLLAVIRGGSVFAVLTDHRGSPLMVVSAEGESMRRLEWTAFGEITADVGDFELPVGFAGGLPDEETGWTHFLFRDYAPRAGRWTMRDPMLFDGGQFNLYAYVHNNPVDWRDPTGLFCVGGDFYFGLGGGLKACFTEDGFSLCSEFGAGYGAGIELNPIGGLDGEKNRLKGELGWGCGPLGLDGELHWDADCGLGANIKGNIGPFEWGTDDGAQLTHDTMDTIYDRAERDSGPSSDPEKCGASGKLAYEYCDRAPW
ncbi:MAG: RHS repeat-associated core domain-containing protein [Bradymonadia bacterium]